MKALICELCGSNNIIKQDGYFVCQNCGTKYSLEEAKKMMVEGTVDVTGSTVKVDTSDELVNLYHLARRYKETQSVEAAKYYDMILLKDPMSWEATFYSSYFAARYNINIGENDSAPNKMLSCLEPTCHLIKEHVQDEKEKSEVLETIYNETLELTDYLMLTVKGNIVTESVLKVLVAKIPAELGDALFKYFSDSDLGNGLAISSWKRAIKLYIKIFEKVPEGGRSFTEPLEQKINEASKLLKSEDAINEYKSEMDELDKVLQTSGNKIKKHSSDSPNKVAAKVLKLGHRTYEAGPLGVQEVFKSGCDEVGHIGAEVIFKNVAGSTIKYATVHITPYNQVDDVAPCTVTGKSTFGIKFTGPIPVGNKEEGFVDGIWYNNSITKAKIDHVEVIYMDDTAERFDVSDLSDDTQVQSAQSKSGGCYVATSVYGSYDCPQVWTLRRFRDYDLAKTWYGRAFIYTYYAISPTIVKCFGRTGWFKRMWRIKLDKMVKKLQEKGYESTPYEDRNW